MFIAWGSDAFGKPAMCTLKVRHWDLQVLLVWLPCISLVFLSPPPPNPRQNGVKAKELKALALESTGHAPWQHLASGLRQVQVPPWP